MSLPLLRFYTTIAVWVRCLCKQYLLIFLNRYMKNYVKVYMKNDTKPCEKKEKFTKMYFEPDYFRNLRYKFHAEIGEEESYFGRTRVAHPSFFVTYDADRKISGAFFWADRKGVSDSYLACRVRKTQTIETEDVSYMDINQMINFHNGYIVVDADGSIVTENGRVVPELAPRG